MTWNVGFLAVAASFAASLMGTRGLLARLRKHGVLDHPNERSSHVEPTPRGGGLAVIATLVPIWAAIAFIAPEGTSAYLWPLAGAVLLAGVSWRDDLEALPVSIRLSVHAIAVAIGIVALAGHGPVFQGLLPLWLDRLAAAFLWLWFLNLFNFMDGIDGMAACETATLGLGTALVAATAGLGSDLPLFGLTAAAAALGFLWWNWQPARIFLGDVGSVPLGFLLGWLLLELACRGAWAPALILPLYYLADATLTLLLRVLRRERIWKAHREHFYQKAAQSGWSHAQVVRRVVAIDGALIALALWAARAEPWLPLGLAALAVAFFLGYLARRKPV